MSKSKLLATMVVSFSLLILGSCGGDQGVGKICDLGDSAASPSRTAINSNASECQTSVCLKVAQDPSKSLLDPPTGALCSAECSSDSDCEGELRDSTNPADTRCKSGFTCGMPFVVGPYCCKKYCMCRDSLGPAGATTPAACQGPDARTTCQGTASDSTPAPVQEDIYLNVAPLRKVDLVFMIDNSPSMAPKVKKLNQQFPKLIEALKDPSDGTYPDLRVAMIDSDLGTGNAYPSGSCGPNESNGNNAYGDVGRFQMRGAAGCGVAANSLWLETSGGRPLNFSATSDISQVFGCLAGNLGTTGCGEEHQLQAFEFALVAQNLHADNPSQSSFLRPEAYLGLVFLSDEDDCSAATNDGMFGDKAELRGESASLRCATRGHTCGGLNLSDSGPGYPTSAPFQTSLASCAARTDSCPNATDGAGTGTDTSGPTSCSPLKDVRMLAQQLKSLKANPDEQVLVAGIFGWPRMAVDAAGEPVVDASGRVQADLTNAVYKIDLVPNPNVADTMHPQVWDSWPVCYDPDHEPAIPGSFDADAWGWGAQGGLRMSAFVDQFGANGLKYSICERDYAQAMRGIGNALARKLHNMCIGGKLKDADPAPGLQPDCRVVYRLPSVDGTTGRVSYVESPQSLPVCAPGATPETVLSECWRLVSDLTQCPTNGQLVSIVRPTRADALPMGTKIAMQCSTCPALASTAGCE